MSKETPKSAPTPKDAPKGLIDSKLFQGFAKAKETFMSKEAAKKGPLGRLWLAFTAFLGEMGLIKKKKEEVSKDTEKSVAKTLEQAKKDAEKDVGLKSGVEEKDKKEFLGFVTTVVKQRKDLSKEREGHAIEGWKKIDKEEKLTVKQSTALGAVAIGTLLELKKDSSSESAFQTKLEKLWRISKKTDYPFEKLFSRPVLKLFAIDGNMEALELLGILDINSYSAMGIKGTLAKLKDGPLSGDDREKAIEFVNKEVFTSSKSDTGKFLDTIGNMMKAKKGKALTPKNLATLIYSVDNKDLERLTSRLGISKGRVSPKTLEKLAA